jgi:hypothetical protein
MCIRAVALDFLYEWLIQFEKRIQKNPFEKYALKKKKRAKLLLAATRAGLLQFRLPLPHQAAPLYVRLGPSQPQAQLAPASARVLLSSL